MYLPFRASWQKVISGGICSEWQARGKDVYSLYADPLFVDPEHNDFRLRPESPAWALGFQPIETPISRHNPRWVCAELPGGLARIHWCRFGLAPFEAPKGTRPAMALNESVVSLRKRAASASFNGSLLHRAASSPSVQPSRCNSSPIKRSALAAAVARRNSPECCSPRPANAPPPSAARHAPD